MRFARDLHAGMTRAEIVRLGEKYGGSGPFHSDLRREPPAYDWRSDGRLDVWFTDYATLCISGGKAFSFYFRPNWTLTEWKEEAWGSAC